MNKKLILIFVLILLVLNVAAQTGSEYFNKEFKLEGDDAVYRFTSTKQQFKDSEGRDVYQIQHKGDLGDWITSGYTYYLDNNKPALRGVKSPYTLISAQQTPTTTSGLIPIIPIGTKIVSNGKEYVVNENGILQEVKTSAQQAAAIAAAQAAPATASATATTATANYPPWEQLAKEQQQAFGNSKSRYEIWKKEQETAQQQQTQTAEPVKKTYNYQQIGNKFVVGHNGNIYTFNTQAEAQTRINELNLEQTKNELRQKQGYEIIGTNLNSEITQGYVYISKDGKISGYNIQTKQIETNLNKITLDEITKGGINIKTTYSIVVQDRKQVKIFESAVIEGITIKDKAVFDDIKTAIGGNKKENIIITPTEVTVKSATGATLFKAIKTNENTFTTRSNYLFEGFYLYEKTYYLGTASAGVSEITYDVRYIKNGKEISPNDFIYILDPEKWKKDFEASTKERIITNYQTIFYSLENGERNLEKLLYHAVGTVWTRKEVKDGKLIGYISEVNTEILIFDERGKIKERQFVYSENGKPVFNPDGTLASKEQQPQGTIVFNIDGTINKEASNLEGLSEEEIKGVESRAETARKQAAARRIFKLFEVGLTQFQGLRGWHMLLDKEGYDEWNKNINKFFSEHLLGIEYRVSDICKHEYDKDVQGIVYGLTPEGTAIPQAHIEGEKSSLIQTPEETQIFYKLTFYVRATYEDVEFNVILKGDREVRLYPQNILLKGDEEQGKGEEFSASGPLAIVQYSSFNYDQVCLDFMQGPLEDTCNLIPESQASITNYQQTQESTPQQTQQQTTQQKPAQI